MVAIVTILIAGLVLLYAGAELLVRGSAALALRLGLTPLVVGLTVVAFGTSSPELVVSVKAALDGRSAISLGNVVGSNIVNIALVLGLSALIRPLQVNAQVVRLQLPVMIIVSVVAWLFLADGYLSRFEGFFFVLGIIAYTGASIRLAHKEAGVHPVHIAQASKQKLRRAVAGVITGLVLLLFGAAFLVHGAVSFASMLGVSEAVIGLTLVAAGTSLPELATSVIATIKREGDISIGNVVGSNIFNILAILGIAALVTPLAVEGIRPGDFMVMIGVSLLTLPLMRSGFVLNRWEGLLLLICYCGYLYYLL